MGLESNRRQLAQQLNEMGVSRDEIAERLHVARSTVNEYLSIRNADEEPLGAMSISDPKACDGHWRDLFDAYPAGIPVAKNPVVRFVGIVATALAMLAWGTTRPAGAHDIYTNLHNKTGVPCCGGTDCAATVYRELGGRFEFFTREQTWVEIPIERIQFIPIPGDTAGGDHLGHLCYRPATPFDRGGAMADSVFGNIYLYCAFIPPGSI